VEEPTAPPDARSARSWLFVPGHRADRFDKAAASGADIVVHDLEDAVSPDDKATARAQVTRRLTGGGVGCVRINGIGTPWHEDDVAALVGAPGLRAVLVPKAEDPRELAALGAALDVPVVALIETALGQHRVHELAAAPGVARLAFGSIDFALDIGADDAALPLLLARSSLVLASRVAGLPAPVDGVTQALDDPAVIARDTAASVGLGFGGKLCVHPRQVAAVNAGFLPSEAAVRQAQQVLAAVGDGGPARIDGRMVDRPVVERARQLLARVHRTPTT
jgi:citrate lyase subunit beta/citryl-CoA lyase